jgi:hypothetical protein
MLNRTTFPDLVLGLKQGEQDTDTGFLGWKLLHDPHPSLNLFETPFNEIGCSYMFPSVCRMTHIDQTGIEIFLQAVQKGRKDSLILLGEALKLSPGFHEIRGVIDPIQLCFDERPFTFGTLGLEIGHLVKEAALMFTIGENCSDGCRYPRTAVRRHHQDVIRLESPPDQLSEQGLPGFLALPVALNEAQVLPLSILGDPHSAEGCLLADSLPSNLEVYPVNKEIGELLGDGPVKPPDQLLLDALIHPAHLGRTHIAAPEKMGDLPHLAGGDPSEEHLRDDPVDPLVLSPVAAHNGAVRRPRVTTSGQPQILNETKTGFELPQPGPIPTVLTHGCSLVRPGANETQELILGISLEHLSHEIPDPHLNMVQKFSDASISACGFIQMTLTRNLINDFFSC